MTNTGHDTLFKLLIYSDAFMHFLHELYSRRQLFIMLMLHEDWFCVLLCKECILLTACISESYTFTNIVFEIDIDLLINSSMNLCSFQMKIEGKKKEKESWPSL